MAKQNKDGLFRVANKSIKFGILVRLDICNQHYLQERDRLKSMQKLDVYTYLWTFELDRQDYDYTEDCIDDNVKWFKDDALWIKSHDGGFDSGSSFYLVCYLVDKDGMPSDMSVIRQLFYREEKYPKRKWTTKIWYEGREMPMVSTCEGNCSAASAIGPFDIGCADVVRLEVAGELCDKDKQG